MFRVYLSGSMQGRPVELVREEREYAVKKFADAGIHAVDPGAAESGLWKKGKKAKIALTPGRKIMEAFVAEDKWLIRHCDCLLVMTGDTPSDGTWWEMAYATSLGIPVVVIAPKRARGQLMGWTNILIPYVVSDLASAIKVIKNTWLRRYEAHKRYFNLAIRHAKMSSRKSRKAKKRNFSDRIPF